MNEILFLFLAAWRNQTNEIFKNSSQQPSQQQQQQSSSKDW
jgi:dsDNA-binding SOS-regulon protein